MAFYGVIPTRQAFPLMEAAAKRALQIDSTLGSAYTLLGVATSFYRWHWAMAESEFRRGIDLDPNDPESHNKFGMYLRTLGRFDEAEAEMRRAVELDPLTRHFAFQPDQIELPELFPFRHDNQHIGPTGRFKRAHVVPHR